MVVGDLSPPSSIASPLVSGSGAHTMRSKANGWTLHSRMETEKLKEFCAIMLSITEYKLLYVKLFATIMKGNWSYQCVLKNEAMLKCKWRLKKNRWELTYWWGVTAALKETDQQLLLLFLVNMQHYSMTLETFFKKDFFYTPLHSQKH